MFLLSFSRMNRCKHAYEFFPSVRVSLVVYISSFYSDEHTHKRSSTSSLLLHSCPIYFSIYEDETSAEFVGNVSFKINDDRGQKSIRDVTMSEFIRFSFFYFCSFSVSSFEYALLCCVHSHASNSLSLYLVYIRVLVIILFFSFCFQSHIFRSFGFFYKKQIGIKKSKRFVLTRRH